MVENQEKKYRVISHNAIGTSSSSWYWKCCLYFTKTTNEAWLLKLLPCMHNCMILEFLDQWNKYLFICIISKIQAIWEGLYILIYLPLLYQIKRYNMHPNYRVLITDYYNCYDYLWLISRLTSLLSTRHERVHIVNTVHETININLSMIVSKN